MKSCKGKDIFIKNNVMGYINTTSGDIKTFDSFVKGTISKKYTAHGTESKFACVVRTEVWPTSTAKGAKCIIIGCDLKESLSRRLHVDDFTRKEIYEKRGSEEGFIPIFKWHRCICKKSKSNLHNVTMLAFSRPILLVSMWTRDMMRDTTFLKESMEFFIFTPQSVCMVTIFLANLRSTYC
jgi:hypothetical protein